MAEFFPRWRFILVDSRDMTRITELKRSTSRSLSVKNNISGKVDWTYPLRDEFSPDIVPFQTGVLAERFNWRATVARNLSNFPGEIWDPIWSGYNLTINEDITGDTMQINTVGWLQRLERRITRKVLNWSNVDDSLIIRDLLRHAYGADLSPWNAASVDEEWLPAVNGYIATDGFTIRWPPAVMSPNVPTYMKWGGTQPNEGAGGPTAYVPQIRSTSVGKYVNILPEIERIISLENGCDINVDPIERKLTAHRRYRRDQDQVDVAFNWGPKNISQLSRGIEGDRAVNYFLAQGDASIAGQYATDVISMQSVGPLEEVASLSSVKNANVLLAYAGAEILVRKNGVVTYGVTPFTYTPENSVPEPFVDYRQGDQIYVSSVYEPRNSIFRQAARVFGMNVSIDDNSGNERLGQLVLAP